MDTALWIIQVLLALVFLMAGAGKVMRPKEEMPERMAFVEDFTQGQIRLIGSLELLGAIGLVLPAVTGILPWLTPTAAVGLALTMVGAALTHRRREEYQNIVANGVLFSLAVFVAYGRFFAEPF